MKYGMCLVLLLGVLAGCKGPFRHNLPPAQMIAEPGPGVGGPGPGVMTVPGMVPPPMGMTSQVRFVGPEGMTVSWDVGAPGMFDSEPQIVPFRYNFPQGAIYRLRLTNIPARPGIELYPTLEVGPTIPRTAAFLAHNAVPVQITEEDLDQILGGNFVTKVIYLPDPEYQDIALAGIETLVSTRLDPGVDPIVEADRRGAILAIVRMGNKDLAIPGEHGDGMMVGMGVAATPGGVPSNYISGVTGPPYGMPMSGTPIGLAGPPHVPLGGPAGLQKHTIRNHTRVNIPNPTTRVRMDVRQTPGISYPRPANHAIVHESTRMGLGPVAPLGSGRQVLGPASDPDCPLGGIH